MSNQPLNRCELVDYVSPTSCARGAANTKSTWTQIIGSTSFHYRELQVDAFEDASDGGGDTWLFDVGIGPAGSETVLIPNLLLDTNRAVGVTDLSITLPLNVPPGSRLAVRPQSLLGSGARNIRVGLLGKGGGGNYPHAEVAQNNDYGTVTASTNATLMDPGGTANTWGSWIQMTGSTVADHNALGIVFGFNQYAGSPTAASYEFQIGVGASGSEQVIGGGAFSYQFNNAPPARVFHAQIPAGARLAIRALASSSSSGARQITAALYGG